MSKMPRHSTMALEVTIMFEPHRLHHDLLQRAYALLVPLPHRRLGLRQLAPVPPSVRLKQDAERRGS
jgi:hypothetical protein